MTHTDIAEMIQVLRDLIEDGFTAAALAGLETLQRDVESLATHPEPAASVSDERKAFEAWYFENVNRAELPDYLPTLETYSSATVANLFCAWKARAALRPVQVPMDKQDAWDNSPVNSDWEAVDAYLQGIEDAEAHHGITAQAKKEGA